MESINVNGGQKKIFLGLFGGEERVRERESKEDDAEQRKAGLA